MLCSLGRNPLQIPWETFQFDFYYTRIFSIEIPKKQYIIANQNTEKRRNGVSVRPPLPSHHFILSHIPLGIHLPHQSNKSSARCHHTKPSLPIHSMGAQSVAHRGIRLSHHLPRLRLLHSINPRFQIKSHPRRNHGMRTSLQHQQMQQPGIRVFLVPEGMLGPDRVSLAIKTTYPYIRACAGVDPSTLE
jgi:hypothetical protein